MGRWLSHLELVWLSQRGHMFPWSPVFVAIGIGIYFSCLQEPSVFVLWLLFAAGGLGLWMNARVGAVLQPILTALVCLAIGFSLAGARAHSVAGPVLSWRYYGPIEGRIIAVDRSASDAVRLTLDRVVLSRFAPNKTPRRVRVSLHGEQGYIVPEQGLVVILTGHLSPPQGAVEPGGFDFRQLAWFRKLGAVGYTRSPVLTLRPADGSLTVSKVRSALSQRVRAVLPGQAGAFAAAVITGDRSGLSLETINNLRRTNLAHLLAISGLHMGLLVGTVFTVLRLLLLLGGSQRWPVKKLAAMGALGTAAVYLALSGGNVATQRAFVMVAVALCAILADRRALSLRAVALAALGILALRPEALLGPGFQMSFAATTALVAVFGVAQRMQSTWPTWVKVALGFVLSSVIAGAATAPYGMAHFNQVARFGLVANLVSVPLMGVLIMPSALLAVCLMPLGLEAAPLWVMGQGLTWILWVADTIAHWDHAVSHVLRPTNAVLPLLTFGALFVVLWQGRSRWFGLSAIALSVFLWSITDRPDILVSQDGSLVGVMTTEGRALSREKGAGFVARSWLENDGDSADQEQAAQRWSEKGAVPNVKTWRLGGIEVVHVIGKTGLKNFTSCSKNAIVFANVPFQAPGPCRSYTPEDLKGLGSVAFHFRPDGLVLISEFQRSGRRLWSPQ